MGNNVENPFDGVVKLMESAEGAFSDAKLEDLTSTAIMDVVKQQIASMNSSNINWDASTGKVSVTSYITREQLAESLERVLNEALNATEREHD